MKNLYVIPTDKPSRLGLNNKVLDYAPLFGFELFDKNKNFRHNPVNIYITSDEEIRRGDYFISLNGDESYLDIILNNEVDDFNEYADVDWIENCKKIIITDNKDLIKDGVQAIDDEFLEWFVKNPSCEEVVTERVVVYDDNNNGSGEIFHSNRKFAYEIIIPREEPKQDRTCTNNCSVVCGECQILKPKQETLEEYIKEVTKNFGDEMSVKFTSGGIKLGAKWQADRSYSEEDMRKAFEAGELSKEDDINGDGETLFDEWFEQHKKK